MTSKVEELRDQVMANCGVGNPWYGDPIAMTVDSLISAAHAEGVAEGAAAERERILSEASFLQHNMDARESAFFIGEESRGEFDGVIARKDCYVVSASVLAPTKEREVVHTKILYPPDEVKP